MSKVIRLLISVSLVAWLCWQMDWRKVAESIVQLQPEAWYLAVALLIGVQLISSARWQMLARALGFDRPLRQLAGFYFIGMYFSLMLPTSVGGDVVRAWYLDGKSGRRMRAFVSVFLDRLCGLWVLLALAGLGVLFSPIALPAWIIASVALCIAGVVGSVAITPFLVRFKEWAPGKIRRALETLYALPSWRVLAAPIALSAIVQIGNIFILMVLGNALGVPVPAAFYWIVTPLVSLLTLLPVSVNGMGVREGGMALLMAPLGVAPELAITLAFLWFTVTVAVSLLGGVVYLFGSFPRPTVSDNSQEEQGDNGSVDRHPAQGRARQHQTAA